MFKKQHFFTFNCCTYLPISSDAEKYRLSFDTSFVYLTHVVKKIWTFE